MFYCVNCWKRLTMFILEKHDLFFYWKRLTMYILEKHDLFFFLNFHQHVQNWNVDTVSILSGIIRMQPQARKDREICQKQHSKFSTFLAKCFNGSSRYWSGSIPRPKQKFNFFKWHIQTTIFFGPSQWNPGLYEDQDGLLFYVSS